MEENVGRPKRGVQSHHFHHQVGGEKALTLLGYICSISWPGSIVVGRARGSQDSQSKFRTEPRHNSSAVKRYKKMEKKLYIEHFWLAAIGFSILY